jgi:hypothetical protein
MADEHVLRVEATERAGRERLEQTVHAEAIAIHREEGVAADCVRDDERPLSRPPERDLLPDATPHHVDDFERRVR